MITVDLPGRSLARGTVLQFNKHFLNPLMLRLAGSRFWYAAALHHTGRRSGRAYVTPVVADAIDDGFLIPLPYGTKVDWLRNVQATGHASLDVHGRTVAVGDPRVLTFAEALPHLSPARARQWRVWRIEAFLHVTGVTQAPEQAVAPPTRSPQ